MKQVKIYRGLKLIVAIISILRITVPSLNLLSEEEMLMGFLKAFDLNLLPWIVFVIIFGRQLSKITLPNWCPPVPVILLLVSFIVCFAFGCFVEQVNSFRGSMKLILHYMLGNGALTWLVANGVYCIGHEFGKVNWPNIKAWFTKIFKKEENND